MESRRTEGRSLQEVTLVDSGHVTLSVFNTLGSEGQGRVPSVYRILKKRFFEDAEDGGKIWSCEGQEERVL